MTCAVPFDASAPSRELVRLLRRQPDAIMSSADILPESILWRVYCELRRRGEKGASEAFVRSVRNLHRRRTIGAANLPVHDGDPEEHKLVDDPMLGELWKAYKRCICASRTGPAAQILRDIEEQL